MVYWYCVPVYSLQGLSIRRWDYKAGPREGFGPATAGLKLPLPVTGVGLEGEPLATPHSSLKRTHSMIK